VVLREWKIPVLVIVGARDSVALRDAAEIRKRLPQTRIERVNAGAFPMWEAPTATFDIVLSTLERWDKNK
jgi:pimeloyl-ACP methyl ester carboxylesterase